MMARRILFLITVISASLLLPLLTEILYRQPVTAVPISGQWRFRPKGSSAEPALLPNPFWVKLADNPAHTPGLYELSTDFSLQAVLSEASLIIPQQPDHGFRIFLNGEFIAQTGDPAGGNGNNWKDFGIFPLPRALAPGRHTLTLEIYALDESGLLSAPYLVQTGRYRLKYFLLVILNRNAGVFMMGIAFISGIILTATGLLRQERNLTLILLGISFLFWVIYLLDYMNIPALPVNYILFKKTVMTSLAVAFLLNYAVFQRILTGRLHLPYRILLGIYALAIAVLIILPGTMEQVRRGYRAVNALIYPVMLTVLFHPRMLKPDRRSLNFILIGGIAALSFALRDIYCQLIGRPYILQAHLGIFIYLVFITLYFVIDYLDKSDRALSEQKRAEHFYRKSVIDPLTGAYNRSILHHIESSCRSRSYAFFIYDLDDFKNINDRYGHQTGDRVLKFLAGLMKESIRSDDYLIRLGGDEFALVLPGCMRPAALQVAEKIQKAIEDRTIRLHDGVLTFRCSTGAAVSLPGESFQSVYNRADKQLYNVKSRGKGFFLIDEDPEKPGTAFTSGKSGS